MKDNVRILITVGIMALALLWARNAWSAEVVDSERLADSIKLAENSKTKPYGIMKDYCHAGAEAQCRKGCIQTIKKHLKRIEHTDAEDFIRKFAEVYAPTKNATNDPNRLNRNWYRNVWAFYSRNSH